MANNSPSPPPLNIGGRRGPNPAMTFDKPKNTKGTAKKLLAYLSGSKKLFYSLILITLTMTILNLIAPALQRLAIDSLSVDGEKLLSVDFATLGVMIALLLLTYIVLAIFTYLQGLSSAKLSQTTVKNMRKDLFEKIVRLPVKFIDTHSHGDLMSRMTNDVENISNWITSSLNSLISGIIILLGSLVIMFYFSPLLTLISMSTIFLSALASTFLSKHMRKYFKDMQTDLGSLNGHIEEMITGFKTVTAFNKQKDAENEFNNISQSLRKNGIKAQVLGGTMGPLMNIISNIGFLLVAVFGGSFAIKGLITIGTIQAFILYTKQFSRSINEIANQVSQIQTAIAGAERIFEILDTTSPKDTNTVAFDSSTIKGDISFKNVCFSYDKKRAVLNNFNLDIKSGEKIAIVGATGSGKTTIVNLLTRFYEIDSGEITIDGIAINSVNRHDLRKCIAIVLQDTVLFSGSIEDNITYGKDEATIDEMEDAAILANADRFIMKMPNDYRTILTENGSSLSAGERQLLAIARAVIVNPKILILDEATSNVDTRTELDLQSAMVRLMKNRTSLIIAHRLSTIRDADKIVVIENGNAVEIGNHDELLEKKDAYFNLYKCQFEGQIT